ncbi:MAG: DNA polymerase III subunit delta [Deltaproteobacteria bacterium]|nr:DNA polymerase III subunit delta [Deltaproteobacteria bacterium]
MARKVSRGRKAAQSDPIDAVEAGQLARVYYVCGESFPRDRLIAAVRKAVVGDDANAFNYDALQGKEHPAAQILAAVRTMPMLGGQRLVQVRDAHEIKADELNKLLPAIEDPSPYAVLLMVGESADLRLKFFNAAKKAGAVVHRYEGIKERQAPGWVATEARRAKIRLGPGAAECVADAVGTDLAQLAGALEQLSLYVGEGQAVEMRDVEELLAQTRQRSIFELTNAVGRRDRREAMLVLKQMLEAREPALRILAMLARHVRQLWSAKEVAAGGAGEKAIADQVGIHPFFVKDILQQAQRFEISTLRRTHRALTAADQRLKSSHISDALVLEQLVLQLCG